MTDQRRKVKNKEEIELEDFLENSRQFVSRTSSKSADGDKVISVTQCSEVSILSSCLRSVCCCRFEKGENFVCEVTRLECFQRQQILANFSLIFLVSHLHKLRALSLKANGITSFRNGMNSQPGSDYFLKFPSMPILL